MFLSGLCQLLLHGYCRFCSFSCSFHQTLQDDLQGWSKYKHGCTLSWFETEQSEKKIRFWTISVTRSYSAQWNCHLGSWQQFSSSSLLSLSLLSLILFFLFPLFCWMKPITSWGRYAHNNEFIMMESPFHSLTLHKINLTKMNFNCLSLLQFHLLIALNTVLGVFITVQSNQNNAKDNHIPKQMQEQKS